MSTPARITARTLRAWIARDYPLQTLASRRLADELGVHYGTVRKWSNGMGDLTRIASHGELDIVSGGPPCQGYSHAGKRQVADPRNNLVFEFARFIVELQPKTFAMEEVPGILSMVTPDGLPVVDTFIRILADGGFGTVDALKKMMAAQVGSFGAVAAHNPRRGRDLSTPSRKPAPPPAPASRQMDMFA